MGLDLNAVSSVTRSPPAPSQQQSEKSNSQKVGAPMARDDSDENHEGESQVNGLSFIDPQSVSVQQSQEADQYRKVGEVIEDSAPRPTLGSHINILA